MGYILRGESDVRDRQVMGINFNPCQGTEFFIPDHFLYKVEISSRSDTEMVKFYYSIGTVIVFGNTLGSIYVNARRYNLDYVFVGGRRDDERHKVTQIDIKDISSR